LRTFELTGAMGEFHELDAVSVGIAEPGLPRMVVVTGSHFADIDAAGAQGFAQLLEAGHLEAEVVVPIALVQRFHLAAPFLCGEDLVKNLDEGGITAPEVGAKLLAVGVVKSELDRKPQLVAIKRDLPREVVGHE